MDSLCLIDGADTLAVLSLGSGVCMEFKLLFLSKILLMYSINGG